ncbi:hypothetical protein NRI_0145 [Neorickettsia risticii str. Illinois]|uniref:Uncharacterized protein n=2 Tax=Neorickettsia risticii TaxID=950 RepID=C6V425_NEORI|nr:hypothetical protein NRI_0145 [Neorickettsia risticii str. Illinois]
MSDCVSLRSRGLKGKPEILFFIAHTVLGLALASLTVTFCAVRLCKQIAAGKSLKSLAANIALIGVSGAFLLSLLLYTALSAGHAVESKGTAPSDVGNETVEREVEAGSAGLTCVVDAAAHFVAPSDSDVRDETVEREVEAGSAGLTCVVDAAPSAEESDAQPQESGLPEDNDTEVHSEGDDAVVQRNVNHLETSQGSPSSALFNNGNSGLDSQNFGGDLSTSPVFQEVKSEPLSNSETLGR